MQSEKVKDADHSIESGRLVSTPEIFSNPYLISSILVDIRACHQWTRLHILNSFSKDFIGCKEIDIFFDENILSLFPSAIYFNM